MLISTNLKSDLMRKFLMISRLLYDKGYRQYVDAAMTIRGEHSDCKFYIAGGIDKSYPNHVPQDVLDNDVESGAIEYLGYQQDIGKFIREMDCIVLPSYYSEGLSRVLMEALAMKKPIITTDIPGCRETVDDGVNGFLCEPKNTQSLVAAIERLLRLGDNELKEMGERGRAKAEQQFDIRKVIKILLLSAKP